MNMILHNNPTAAIHGGQSTLAAPFFKDGDTLKTFDFVVAKAILFPLIVTAGGSFRRCQRVPKPHSNPCARRQGFGSGTDASSG